MRQPCANLWPPKAPVWLRPRPLTQRRGVVSPPVSRRRRPQARRLGDSGCPSQRTVSQCLRMTLSYLLVSVPPISPRSVLRLLRHEDLREGSASESFLFDDVQLQMLSELSERAVPCADRDRERRQLIFIDEAQAGQRACEVGAAVDEDCPFV